MSLMNKWWETEAGKHITSKKYFHEGETFSDFVSRVSGILSTDELKIKMGDALCSAEFFPAGRSLYGAGSKGKFKASMSNCYILPSPKDNIENIFDTAKEMARIYSYGGGCGVNISNLRPNESIVNNSAQTSSGAVSFMELYNTVGKIIGASNKKKGETSARRAALMIGLNCDHPDIEEFLDIKKNNTEIQSANISILFNDDFMNAVKNNQEYTLSFQTEHEMMMKKINAREFFMKFAENNHGYAEPGAIFIDNVRKHHLLSGYPQSEYSIEIPNPCAEFYGNEYNACNLGSINSYAVVVNPFTEKANIDWEKLRENVRFGVTALDEILNYGRDMQPLEKNKTCIDDWRSIGLGIFGLGDTLIALGIKYGSRKSRDFIDKFMSFVSTTALETSADLAAEKGTFGKYNWEYVKQSPIIDALKKTNYALYKKIETNGLRNASLLSIAPTGSIATMCGLSGGVEPLFAISYQRTTHSLSGEKKYFKVFAKSVEDLLKHHELPLTLSDEEIIERFPFVTISHEIDPHDRIAVQSVMQKYVDNAISSTINLKEEVTVQAVFDIYMDAWESGCKGITVFRNNCLRTAILVTNDSKQLKEDTKQENDKPFEFDSVIPFKAKEVDELDGKRFVKHTACVPSMYINITHKDGNIYEVFTNAGSGCHSNISTITRLASLAFRLGGKVKEVTKEMRANQCPACIVLKQKGDKTISNSCGSAIADAVEKMYEILKNNPKAEFTFYDNTTGVKKVELKSDGKVIEYMECPECHEKTLRPEAKCFNCSNCGYSRCE